MATHGNCRDWIRKEVIAFGYYDGPTQGMVRLADARVYWFEMIAEDVDRELRVFALSALEPGLFDVVVTALSAAVGVPTWPLWVPKWEFDNESIKHDMESLVDTVCSRARLAVIMASDDSLVRCVAFRNAVAQDTDAIQTWLEQISSTLSH
jgi:hypothetical protein